MRKIILYIAAVTLKQFINSKPLCDHVSGRLPFGADMTSLIRDGSNKITVAVNNTLSHHTIPQANFEYTTGKGIPAGYFKQKLLFDFFNYAGIERPVHIYSVPQVHISDIKTKTRLIGSSGVLDYEVIINGTTESPNTFVDVYLLNHLGDTVGKVSGSQGSISVPNINAWWPRGMNDSVGYLYKLKVVLSSAGVGLDEYELTVGFRTVEIRSGKLLINGQEFYFKGYGMHEDADIRGKGFDMPVMTKDLNLLEWTGANAFRTSHYPYAEERMFECDRRGIVVIDEVPAVGIRYFTDDNLKLHRSLISQMISRDQNHPSIVMWSLANEANTENPKAVDYFNSIVKHAKRLDDSRPVTVVLNSDVKKDLIAHFLDIICINRYFGWYENVGEVEIVSPLVENNLREWNEKFNRPIIVTEYGAGSVISLNANPSTTFSESYQLELLSNTHQAFDILRNDSILIGEMLWNMVDFMTVPEVNRVVGNRKGIFTRDRQPKQAAYLMRKRYNTMK